MHESLVAWGYPSSVGDDFAPFSNDHVLGRVIAEHRGMYTVATDRGEGSVELAGRLRHNAGERSELPAVGDWVAIRDGSQIAAVLPRSTAFVRKEAGVKTEGQVLAANIDQVWIVASLALELSARRIERYLAIAWDSGAQPVVVLTKADVADADTPMVHEIRQVAIGSDVIVTSALTGEGLDQLRISLQPNRTAALLGSSGVGKSTLTNALVGEEHFVTQETRPDAVGRHTTTHREMVQVPSGGLLIDTPGLRELLAWDEDGADAGFSDIVDLVSQCRFGDCSHAKEPGCAIRDAFASGELDQARWRSYTKMLREERYVSGRKTGLAKKQAKAAKARKLREIEDREGAF